MTVAHAHAHIQRLISVVKMATVLEEYTAENQFLLCVILWAKGLNENYINKKYFLFPVGSVCRLKLFTILWQTFRR
jgi:hypothetical protein